MDASIQFTKKQKMLLVLVTNAVLFLLIMTFAILLSSKANAINENNEELPPSVLGQFFVNPGCWNQAGNRLERHSGFVWLSPAGNSAQETITLSGGQDSVNLWFNTVSAQCNSNIDASGNLIDTTIEYTKSTTVSSSTSFGTLSLSSGYSLLDFACSHVYQLRWVKICGAGFFDRYPVHQDLTLSGLSALGPGTHNITISMRQRLINRYVGNFHRCVAQVNGQYVNAANLDDPICDTITQNRTITIIVPDSNSPIGALDVANCSLLGGWALDPNAPTSSIDVHIYRYHAVTGALLHSYNYGPTNVLRTDVNNAYTAAWGIPVTGNHGFNYSIPASWNDGNPSRYDVYGINVGAGVNMLIGRKTVAAACQNFQLDARRTINDDGSVLFESNNSGNGDSFFSDGSGAQFTRQIWVNGGLVYNTQSREIVNAGSTWSESRPVAVSPGDIVCAGITVLPNQGTTGVSGYTTSPPVAQISSNGGLNVNCVQIFAKPYLRVYGHDTVVGLPFADPATGACTRPKVAGQGIETFARTNGGDYVGAGSQFAASATGTIDQFISASLRNDNPGEPITPTGLSFGNYSAGPLGFNATGGDDAGYRGCIPDYVSTAPDTYFTLGPTLGGEQTGFLYRDGDLVINSNITHSGSATWPSLENLQGLTGGWPVIIVKGNVYIRPNVNRIDAILIAVPEDPTKGIIGTCVPDEPAGGVFGECLNKLEINGALVARKVYFNRLNGDIVGPSGDESATSGNIAEVINFYPEFFLVFTKAKEDSSLDSKSRYESIVGLPPVL